MKNGKLVSFGSGALEHFGFHALTASCGEEAVVLWEEIGPKVDLVLTDLVMPEKQQKLSGRMSSVKKIQSSK